MTDASPRGAGVDNGPTEPSLCVILPNFNHGQLVSRALYAILSQDVAPDEIVIVDDCSTDDSLEVMARFVTESVPVRILANEQNLGTARSLQRGLESTDAAYIYFAAADDWVMPGFFATAKAMLAQYPDAGLFCGETALIEGETGRFTGFRPPVRPIPRAGYVSPDRVRRLLRRNDNFVLTGSTVFRRAALEAAGGLDASLGSFADGVLARKIVLQRGFCYAPAVLATWCVFRDGFSRRTALDRERARSVLASLPPRLAEDPAFPAWYPAAFARRWRFGAARLAVESMPHDVPLLEAMAGRSALDRLVFGAVRKTAGERLGKYAILAWLWLRLRPYSLVDLTRTALARRWQDRRSRRRGEGTALGRVETQRRRLEEQAQGKRDV